LTSRADIDRDDEDPARHAEMADSLSMAMLVLLDRLSPEQRADSRWQAGVIVKPAELISGPLGT
jgi:hypothetical protein